jgi:hypothetical protein
VREIVTTMSKLRRDLEFTSPDGRGVTGFRAEPILAKLFAMLVPGQPLPAAPTTPAERTYSWGVEQEYRNAQGDGILIGEQCVRSALPGENVDTVYSLRIGNELGVFVEVAQDYAQDTLVFALHATPELLDPATDALLATATAAGLVLARRIDTPARQ